MGVSDIMPLGGILASICASLYCPSPRQGELPPGQLGGDSFYLYLHPEPAALYIDASVCHLLLPYPASHTFVTLNLEEVNRFKGESAEFPDN